MLLPVANKYTAAHGRAMTQPPPDTARRALLRPTWTSPTTQPGHGGRTSRYAVAFAILPPHPEHEVPLRAGRSEEHTPHPHRSDVFIELDCRLRRHTGLCPGTPLSARPGLSEGHKINFEHTFDRWMSG